MNCPDPDRPSCLRTKLGDANNALAEDCESELATGAINHMSLISLRFPSEMLEEGQILG
jgi:hypothetical protein